MITPIVVPNDINNGKLYAIPKLMAKLKTTYNGHLGTMHFVLYIELGSVGCPLIGDQNVGLHLGLEVFLLCPLYGESIKRGSTVINDLLKTLI